MLSGKWYAPEATPEAAARLREEALGAAADAARDALCHTALLSTGEEAPAAMGQLYWADGAFWLCNVCVREGLRGQGLGDATVRLLLYRAQGHGAREARLRCPAELWAFFARYGFGIAGQDGPGADVEMALDMRDLALSRCHGGCTGDCANCQE